MSEPGTLRADGDRCAVRFERLYDATPDELWAALTDPEELGDWLADASRFELRVGGDVHLRFGDGDEVHGAIRELDPKRLLEYTWAYSGERKSVVRFEIVAREGGSLLVLEHRQLTRDVGAEYGAGWHAHLDRLDAHLAGASLEFMPRYEELRPSYDERATALGSGWEGPGGSPLLDALRGGDETWARELASERPELKEERDAEGLLPAMRALYTRGRELADALAPPEDRLDVFVAAALGRVERLRALLDEEPGRAASFSPDGFTPLHLACFSGGVEATRLLIERGAPLETLARHAQVRVRPLGTAAFSRDRESARALLEAGADANGAGAGGFTPLHTAAQNGDVELVRLLLEHGGDPHVATPDRRTAEDVARDAGHAALLELLAPTHG